MDEGEAIKNIPRPHASDRCPFKANLETLPKASGGSEELFLGRRMREAREVKVF